LLRSRNPLYERDLALRTRSFWMFGGISHIEGEPLTIPESEKPTSQGLLLRGTMCDRNGLNPSCGHWHRKRTEATTPPTDQPTDSENGPGQAIAQRLARVPARNHRPAALARVHQDNGLVIRRSILHVGDRPVDELLLVKRQCGQHVTQGAEGLATNSLDRTATPAP